MIKNSKSRETVTIGPEGTYSHIVASTFADRISFRNSPTDIVKSVGKGRFERGVIPVEHSIEANSMESLDALIDHEIAIIGEIATPVHYALLAQNETFSRIASHPNVLALCRPFIEREYPDTTLEAAVNAAHGIRRAQADPSVAGIGHPDNAGDNLQVLAKDIQDQSAQDIRFFVIGAKSERSENGTKSTIIIVPNEDYPGLLLELLEVFADHDINLTRIESRPTSENSGEYLFHIDFEAGLREERVKRAIMELEEMAPVEEIRWQGSYDVKYME